LPENFPLHFGERLQQSQIRGVIDRSIDRGYDIVSEKAQTSIAFDDGNSLQVTLCVGS